MKEIIFAKYANERDDRFKIKTVILQDENGNRYVEKYALTEEAKAHLAGIAKHQEQLQTCAENTRFRFNQCTAHGGYVDCEYLNGEPLSALLVRAVSAKDYKGALKLIQEYNDQLQSMATETFAVTEEFEAVFGKAEFTHPQKSCPITDIDLIFSNIIVDDGNWNVLDYEWTFDFPVPVNFVLYRAILYSGEIERDMLEKEGVLASFGIGEQEKQQFWNMEMSFQNYVKGKESKLGKLHLMQTRSTIEDALTEKQNQIAALANQLDRANQQIAGLTRQVDCANQQIALLMNSRSYRITKPLRTIGAQIRKNKAACIIVKGAKSLLREGFSTTWRKARFRVFVYLDRRSRRTLYTAKQLNKQRTHGFSRNITFSILVPVYNTPEKSLREMIHSVLDQTYGKWELCLADGSDAEHTYVGDICKEFAQQDSRIRYKKLEKNLGISGNANACIEMATGEYLALLNHDDLLHPAALYEMMKAICRQNADFLYTDEDTFRDNPGEASCPNHKPDFAPDTLRSYNYISHFTAFKRELLEKAGGGFRNEYEGCQDYDLILRLTEQAEKIVHIPVILYHWHCHADAVASDGSSKPCATAGAKRALQAHLDRVGLKGTVEDAAVPSTYRIRYAITGQPLISILIANKDHISDLKKCLNSIQEKSTYPNWEIIVIENNSTEKETFDFYTQIQRDPRIRVIRWDGEFNYSAINNFGVQNAKGEYILLLNNDIEVITPDWLEQMLMFAQRGDVGAVGAMLYYPDDTVQHAGVIVGLGGVAGHAHKHYPRGSHGYMGRMSIAQNYSCVTAACLMTRRKVWDEVGGLDEGFKVAFNDVDMCMRIRKAGYLIVWTPYAEMYHYESKSRGVEDTREKRKRFEGEIHRFQKRWAAELSAGDPYYNPNLTLATEDFTLK